MSSSRFKNDLRATLKGSKCIYCGDLATEDEHFPPATYGLYGVILPICRECNSLAGTAWPINFEARAEYVKRRLEIKYKTILKTKWDPEEIQELGFNLKTAVKSCMQKQKSIRARLAWNAMAYLQQIDDGRFFVATDAAIRIIIKNEKKNSQPIKNGNKTSLPKAFIDKWMAKLSSVK